MAAFRHIAFFIALLVTHNQANPMSLKITFSAFNDPERLKEEKLNAITTHRSSNGTFYAGLYNGYGGSHASKYLAKCLHENIFSDQSFDSDPESALYNAYVKTHFDYAEDETMNGVAVASVLVKGSKIYAANAGDVQIVAFGTDGELTMLSELHSVSKEFDRIKKLMSQSDDQFVSSTPRDYFPQEKLPSFVKSEKMKTQTTHISPRTSLSSPRLLQEVAASPRGSSSLMQQIPSLEKITANIHLKDIEVERLSRYDSQKVSIQTIYLAKKRPGSDIQDFTSLSRGLCNHSFAPYLIPDPSIKSIDLTEKTSFIIMATKRFWLAIKPELAGGMVKHYLSIAQDFRLARRIPLDEIFSVDTNDLPINEASDHSSHITQSAINFVLKMLWEKAFPDKTQSGNSLAIIFFDHES